MSDTEKVLRLTFHGRIIDHLGIQMYQSPVAAIAEIISNSWDADAEKVTITLPSELNDGAELVVLDDGLGMTFDECQEHYLKVGWCRRENESSGTTEEKNRPVLGRKGIGKFAGFGIAEIIQIETISKKTGERTAFILDINQLRSGEYIETKGGDISVEGYDPPNVENIKRHGTTIRLRKLKLGRRPSPEAFRKSMARRFLLHQRAEDFRVLVNDSPLPEDKDSGGLEFIFPRDYRDGEHPRGLTIEDTWGVEHLSNGREIKWRVFFYKNPIEEEELGGVSVFSRGKIAQKPFFFNLSGGLGGQHGQEYMSGQVEADYIDNLDEDIIATERQRINWEHKEAVPLEEWGQSRIKTLLRIWHDRRGEKRRREIEEKMAEFSSRLESLPPHEKKTVKTALTKVGSISTLSDKQFRELGQAILQTWEQGRLRVLIDEIANMDSLVESDLLNILVEAQVLTALNTAEAVKTKLQTVGGLKIRIEKRELETAVRDYIALNPWLISPEWETFRIEMTLKKLLEESAREAKLEGDAWKGRIDLALSSGDQLLVLEFMRPGLKLDWDHVSRFERYVRIIRTKLEPNTAGRFRYVTGYIVADKLQKVADIADKIKSMRKDRMFAMDWETLFSNALAIWQEFLEILVSRAPNDERLKALQR